MLNITAVTGRQKCPKMREQGWELAVGRASRAARAPMKHPPWSLAPADGCVPVTHDFASPGRCWAPDFFFTWLFFHCGSSNRVGNLAPAGFLPSGKAGWHRGPCQRPYHCSVPKPLWPGGVPASSSGWEGDGRPQQRALSSPGMPVGRARAKRGKKGMGEEQGTAWAAARCTVLPVASGLQVRCGSHTPADALGCMRGGGVGKPRALWGGDRSRWVSLA